MEELNAGTYQSIKTLNQKTPQDEAPDGRYWEQISKHYLFQGGLIMMNNGTVGPMPRPVLNTLIKGFKVQASNPFDFYNYLPQKLGEVRNTLARFINASPQEVVITRNTTEGMNFIAHGLDLKPGDEVLISSLEHPGGIHPWRLKAKRYGIVVKEVKLNVPPRSMEEIVQAFEKAITSRTRIISISHTVYITGLITPLKELCQMAHRKGILVLADSAHGIGMLNLDMKDLGIDFWTSSPYKWLGAPTGRGVLYIRKDHQEKVWPTIATSGWDTYKNARKFETFSQRAEPLTFALGEAMDFQLRIGKKRIERRIKALSAYLKNELLRIPGVRLHLPTDPYLSGGLTAFSLEGVDPGKIVSYLREKYNLVIRTVGRKRDNTAGVRVSTPIYVTFKHVDMILQGVRHLSRRKK
jgi:selenocysteine lyase/cysteine desulfurase